MSIELRRLGSHSVNLVIMHGRIDRDALLGFGRSIDPGNPANSLPWVLYMSPDADLSGVDIAAYAELNRLLAPIRDKAAAKQQYFSVIVSNSEYCDALIEFWRELVAKHSASPPYTILFSDIKGVCESLNLPASAQGVIADALRVHRARKTDRAGGSQPIGPEARPNAEGA